MAEPFGSAFFALILERGFGYGYGQNYTQGEYPLLGFEGTHPSVRLYGNLDVASAVAVAGAVRHWHAIL